ncbi:MAG: response regulator [bacterium]|nr:response regulator [bacterium]
MTLEESIILVVDDENLARTIMTEILQEEQHSVIPAKNGLDALEQLEKNPTIDMIVSDMNMPGMNGLELIKELKKRERDVPVIILTSNDQISIAVEALKSGASDYLLKDENIDRTLSLSVERVREKRRLKNELAQKNIQLKKSNCELLELNDLKNEFLGIAAHDMRNPVTVIGEISEILLDEGPGALTEEQKELLEMINEASEGMLTLLNNLLDVSKIESGKLEIKIRKTSFKKILSVTVKLNKLLARKKDITFNTNIPEIPSFRFDPEHMTQVFDNLMSNAIKFSPPGSTIYISLEQKDNLAKVTVKDEGPGISENDQARLFKEFQRLSAKPTGGETTTGLGLVIVKKIIEAHSGFLEVTSKPGEGATFSFSIPMI